MHIFRDRVLFGSKEEGVSSYIRCAKGIGVPNQTRSEWSREKTKPNLNGPEAKNMPNQNWKVQSRVESTDKPSLKRKGKVEGMTNQSRKAL